MYQFLQKEEAARITLLQEEEEQKKLIMKKKTDGITRDILTFSHAVIAVENEIAASDTQFLQVCELLITGCCYQLLIISGFFFFTLADVCNFPNHRITRI